MVTKFNVGGPTDDPGRTEKCKKYFGQKPIQIWSFQGIVVPKKMHFLTRNPMVISPGPGEAQISQLYRKNNKKWVYKKSKKSYFGHKSTPDGLPDPEDIYPGVLGHAESDFDSARAPKS